MLNTRLSIDWVLFAATLPIMVAGLVTINSFAEGNTLFEKQLLWTILSIIAFFSASFMDVRIIRRTAVVVIIFLINIAVLAALLLFGETIKGAKSWFYLGPLSFQPSDPAKLALIILLAKYFSRRHIEIARMRHIAVSGAYTLLLLFLVFLQPDFGSSIIIFLIWLVMILVAGISKKHLAALFLIITLCSLLLWSYTLKDYQKQRIFTFLRPYADVRGAGYNAYQSVVAVGSGEIFGKGIGFGTQSRLLFLPEYETDFVFAAFAEEWGFVGTFFLIILYGVVIFRIVLNARSGAANFEVLFGVGVAAFFISHFIVHVGMNIGLLPVTGTPLPLASYGGSHLLTEFVALGMLMSMRRYSMTLPRSAEREIVGIVRDQ